MSLKRKEKDEELERGVKFRKQRTTTKEETLPPSRKFFLAIPDGASMLLETRRNALDKKRKHTKSQRPCKAMKKPAADCILGSGYEALEEIWALADSCHTAVTEQDLQYLQQLQMENCDGCFRFIQTDMNGALAPTEEGEKSSIRALLPKPSGSITPRYGLSEMVRSGKIVPPSLVLNPYQCGSRKGYTTESNKLLSLLSECGGSADESLLLRLQQPHNRLAGQCTFSPSLIEGNMNDTIDEAENDVGNMNTVSVTAMTVRRKDHGKNKRNNNNSTNNNNNNLAPLQSEQSKEADAHQLIRRQWLCGQLGRMLAVDGLFPPVMSSSSSSSSSGSPLSGSLTNGLTLGSNMNSYINTVASSGRGNTRSSNSSNSSSIDHSKARMSTNIDEHGHQEDDEEVSVSNNHNNTVECHTLRLGKRGRWYREVWEEEDYLSSLLLNRPSLPPQGSTGATVETDSTNSRNGTGNETVSVRSLLPMEDWSELIQSYSDTHDGHYRDWSMHFSNHIATLMNGEENDVKTAAKLSANPVVTAMADHPVADMGSRFFIVPPPVPSAVLHPACWSIRRNETIQQATTTMLQKNTHITEQTNNRATTQTQAKALSHQSAKITTSNSGNSHDSIGDDTTTSTSSVFTREIPSSSSSSSSISTSSSSSNTSPISLCEQENSHTNVTTQLQRNVLSSSDRMDGANTRANPLYEYIHPASCTTHITTNLIAATTPSVLFHLHDTDDLDDFTMHHETLLRELREVEASNYVRLHALNAYAKNGSTLDHLRAKRRRMGEVLSVVATETVEINLTQPAATAGYISLDTPRFSDISGGNGIVPEAQPSVARPSVIVPSHDLESLSVSSDVIASSTTSTTLSTPTPPTPNPPSLRRNEIDNSVYLMELQPGHLVEYSTDMLHTWHPGVVIERHCEHHDEGCTILRSLLIQALDSFEGDWVRISILTIHRRQHAPGPGLDQGLERQGCMVRGLVHTLNGHLSPPGTHLNEQVFRACGVHLDNLDARGGLSNRGVDAVDAAARLSDGRDHDRLVGMLEGETAVIRMDNLPAGVPMEVEPTALESGPGLGPGAGRKQEQEQEQAIVSIARRDDAPMMNQSTCDDVSSSSGKVGEKMGEKVGESVQVSADVKTTFSSIASSDSFSDDQHDASVLAVLPASTEGDGADVDTDGVTDNGNHVVAGDDTSFAGDVSLLHLLLDADDMMDQAAVMVVCGESGGGIDETGREVSDALAVEQDQGLAQGQGLAQVLVPGLAQEPEPEHQSQGLGQAVVVVGVVGDVHVSSSSIGDIVEKDGTQVVVSMEQKHDYPGYSHNNDDSNNTATVSTITANNIITTTSTNDGNVDAPDDDHDNDDDDEEIDALVAHTLSKYYRQQASNEQLSPPPSLSSSAAIAAVETSSHTGVNGVGFMEGEGNVVGNDINDKGHIIIKHNHNHDHDHSIDNIHLIMPSEHSMQSLSSESSDGATTMATTDTLDIIETNYTTGEPSLPSPFQVPTSAGDTTTGAKTVATASTADHSTSPTSTKGCTTRTASAGGKNNGTTSNSLYGAVRNASTAADAGTDVRGGGKSKAYIASGGSKGVTGAVVESGVRGVGRLTGTARGMGSMENAFDNNTTMTTAATTTKIKPVNTMLHEKFGLDLG